MSDAGLRKFRFAAGGEGKKEERGARNFIKLVTGAEEMGYDTFAMPDHMGDMVGPFAALGAAAASTSTIRLATSMLACGMRNPAVAAKELATIDQLSRGRLEVGVGAGFRADEYAKAGIEFGSPAQRLKRLEETLIILDGLLRGDEVNFAGEYFTVEGLVGYPRPRQGPRPPLAVGAGGPRLLELAARYADIINIATSSVNGKMRLSDMTLANTQKRVERVKAAAGVRFSEIELSWTVAFTVVTDDREATADMVLGMLEQGYPPEIEVDAQLSKEDILTSPYLAIGSFDEIADHIRMVRRETTMSYVGVIPTQMEAFAPVVAQLAGE